MADLTPKILDKPIAGRPCECGGHLEPVVWCENCHGLSAFDKATRKCMQCGADWVIRKEKEQPTFANGYSEKEVNRYIAAIRYDCSQCHRRFDPLRGKLMVNEPLPIRKPGKGDTFTAEPVPPNPVSPANLEDWAVKGGTELPPSYYYHQKHPEKRKVPITDDSGSVSTIFDFSKSQEKLQKTADKQDILMPGIRDKLRVICHSLRMKAFDGYDPSALPDLHSRIRKLPSADTISKLSNVDLENLRKRLDRLIFDIDRHDTPRSMARGVRYQVDTNLPPRRRPLVARTWYQMSKEAYRTITVPPIDRCPGCGCNDLYPVGGKIHVTVVCGKCSCILVCPACTSSPMA